MADFLMPALGADMETGRVVQWLVAPGAAVRSGDVVAVVETHKGAIDVEIFLDGVIGELVPLNTPLPVGAVLARVTPPESAALAAGPLPGAVLAPLAGRPDASQPAPQAPAVPLAVTSLRTLPNATVSAHPLVSPAARQRARQLGVDLDGLQGTGGGGVVTLADVARAAASQPAVPAAASPAVPAPSARGGGFDLAQMRQAIAAAMTRSKREIPHYYLGRQVDFAAASQWLTGWNAERPPAQRMLPAVLLLKATARALQAVPQLNGFYENGAFRPGAGIHIGWAIALRGGGLVAPAIHHVDRQPLPDLMEHLRDLVQRARSVGLRSSELTDPTITVTSLGDRGADTVFGVIYPPQVAIVGFGRLQTQAWVVDGQVQARPLLQASLAADHRASDGHLGGQLLAAIDQALQSPENL